MRLSTLPLALPMASSLTMFTAEIYNDWPSATFSSTVRSVVVRCVTSCSPWRHHVYWLHIDNEAVIGCASGEIYRFKDCECIAIIQAHGIKEPVLCMYFNPVTGNLITGSKDANIKTWDANLKEVGVPLDLSEDVDGDGIADSGSLNPSVLSVHQIGDTIWAVGLIEAQFGKALRVYSSTPRTSEELVLDVIFQVKVNVNKVPGGKLQVLKDIYDYMTMQQSIVFVERREGANKVAQFMRDSGLSVSVLHSDLTGPERDQVMAEFRRGVTKVLITTNVLARGVDVPAVAVVVNYDLPTRRNGQRTEADPATYLHRIGRSGRFGRKGTAISFVETAEDERILQTIEQSYFPSGQPMLKEWDATDIDGLTRAVEDRPATGAIMPQALEGNEVASVNVSTAT
eukprot:gene7989-5750_t